MAEDLPAVVAMVAPLRVDRATFGKMEWAQQNPRGTAHWTLHTGAGGHVIAVIWEPPGMDAGLIADKLGIAWNSWEDTKALLAEAAAALDPDFREVDQPEIPGHADLVKRLRDHIARLTL